MPESTHQLSPGQAGVRDGDDVPVELEAARRLLPVGRDHAPLNRVAALAASLLAAPSAQVSLLTEVQTVAGGAGLAADAVGTCSPLEDSLCTVTASLGTPLVVPDTRADPLVSGLPPVTSGAVSAYLGVPLLTDTGAVIGALCVFDPDRHSWTDRDVATLQHLAEFVRAELELAALGRELDDSRTRWELTVEAGDVGSFDRDLTTGALRWDDRLAAIYGYEVEDSTFHTGVASFRERLHPDDAAHVDRAVALAVDTIGPLHVHYRVVLPDGRVRWLEARGRALAGPDGVPSRLIGVAWDVTEEHEVAARGDRVLASMSIGYLATDDQWRVTYVNDEAARLVGSPTGEMVGRTLWELFPVIHEEAKQIFLQVARTGEPGTHEGFYAPLGSWYEIRAVSDHGGVSLYFHNVTERRRSLELLQLAVDVSEQMVGAVSIEAAVSVLAKRVIPEVADWSIVTLVDDTGPRDVQSWHRDPALRPAVERFSRHRYVGGGAGVVDEVIRTAAPVSVPVDVLDFGLRTLPSAEAREAFRRLAPESAVTVPLLADDRVTGVMTLGRGPDRPPMHDQELALVLSLGRRAGLAIDNARLYAAQAEDAARDRTVAEALQQALLTTLPQPPHLELAARYRTAADGDQVGGDWYDAVVGPDGDTTVIIGDVVGHDISAAAIMGQLRTMLRMLVLRQDESPSEILRGLDQAADDLRLNTQATVLAARIEPHPDGHADGSGLGLRWSNAGHPPPILLRADGTAELLTGPEADLMLGVQPGIARADHRRDLPPDCTLVLYTDGLVERRGEDLDVGIRRLTEALARHEQLDLDALLDRVLLDTVADKPDDDIAVVAVRLRP